MRPNDTMLRSIHGKGVNARHCDWDSSSNHSSGRGQLPVTVNGGFKMPAWYDIIDLSPAAPEDAAGIKKATQYGSDRSARSIIITSPLSSYLNNASTCLFAPITLVAILLCH